MDEWVDAKFYAYSQHLDAIEERRAYFFAKAIAPMLCEHEAQCRSVFATQALGCRQWGRAAPSIGQAPEAVSDLRPRPSDFASAERCLA